MSSARRPFREFDDSHDAEALRLARRVIRGLALSMRHIVVNPGSRSAPLAYALAEAEQLGVLKVHMRIDERSAAFTALGIALATGEPVGVVTTSGTAAGNLLPAVMEADMSGTPLVVLTADRPEALHGTGANQTTWQQGMFTSRVRDELHIDQAHIRTGQVRLEPHSRDDLLAAETQAALLLRAAVQSTPRAAPGPVHLNIGFADPLVPSDDAADHPHTAGTVGASGRWARQGVIPPAERRRLYSEAQQRAASEPGRGHRDPQLGPVDHLEAAALIDQVQGAQMQGREAQSRDVQNPEGQSPEVQGPDVQGRAAGQPSTAEDPVRTLFVMGHAAPAEAVALARRLGHPMLAEPSSGARWSDLGPVQGYRLLLQAPEGSPAAQLVASAQLVVVAGRPTLSRQVQRLITRRDIEVVQYAPAAEPWFDERLPRRVVSSLEELTRLAGRGAAEWSQQWESAGLRAQSSIDSVLREEDDEVRMNRPHPQSWEPAEPAREEDADQLQELNSVRVAQFVAETVRTPLLLGSSSVIRDVDLAAVLTRDPASPQGAEVYAMRGLSGIDGNVSASAGISLASGRRVTALVGDLTLLHDVNGLLIPSTERVPNLDVVVINDAGGAIFDQLEHGDVGRRPGRAETVERLFGTPQAVDIEALADAYHHQYVCASSLSELGEALQHPDDRLGIRLIEIRTDRSRLRNLHAKIAEAVAELE